MSDTLSNLEYIPQLSVVVLYATFKGVVPQELIVPKTEYKVDELQRNVTLVCKYKDYNNNVDFYWEFKRSKSDKYKDVCGVFRKTISCEKGFPKAKMPYMVPNCRDECDASLMIMKPKVGDKGIYKCRAYSRSTTVSFREISLDVMPEQANNQVILEIVSPHNVTSFNGSTIYTFNSSIKKLVFLCKANGIPEPVIEFRLNAHRVYQNMARTRYIQKVKPQGKFTVFSELSIKRSLFYEYEDKANDMTWTCSATSKKKTPNYSDPIRTAYQFAPKISKGNFKNPYRYKENTDVNINCFYDVGFPKETQTKWLVYNSKEVMTSGANLKFSKSEFDRNKAGKYTCKVSNSVGEDSYTIEIIVTYHPEITIDAKTSVQEGNDLDVECVVNASPSAEEIYWLDNNNMQVSKDKTLHISSISRNQAGNYTCRAKNVLAEVKKTTLVTVQYKPIVTFTTQLISGSRKQSGDTHIYKEGDGVEFNCEVDSEPLSKEITILKNAAKFENQIFFWFNKSFIDQTTMDHYFKPSDGHKRSVSIPKVTRDDYGTYTCNANNHIGDVSAKLALKIQYAPTVSAAKNNTMVVREGESLNIRCSANSIPSAQVNWTKGNKIVSDNDQLFLPSPKMGDAGSYQCNAKVTFYDNSSASGSDTIKLFVQYKPTIKQMTTKKCVKPISNGIYRVPEGDSITFCCIIEMYPDGAVKWLPDIGKTNTSDVSPGKINKNMDFYVVLETYLLINKVQPKHFRDYTCVATNVVGNSNFTFSLGRVLMPTIPQNITCDPVTNGATLNWNATGDGGSKQFIRINSRNLQSDKIFKPVMKAQHVTDSFYTFNNLKPNSKYEFTLMACNSVGCSEKSPAVSVRTPVAERVASPSGLSINYFIALPLLLVCALFLSIVVIIALRRKRGSKHDPHSRIPGDNDDELEELKQSDDDFKGQSRWIKAFDKSTFAKLRGEPDGKDRVRFMDESDCNGGVNMYHRYHTLGPKYMANNQEVEKHFSSLPRSKLKTDHLNNNKALNNNGIQYHQLNSKESKPTPMPRDPATTITAGLSLPSDEIKSNYGASPTGSILKNSQFRGKSPPTGVPKNSSSNPVTPSIGVQQNCANHVTSSTPPPSYADSVLTLKSPTGYSITSV